MQSAAWIPCYTVICSMDVACLFFSLTYIVMKILAIEKVKTNLELVPWAPYYVRMFGNKVQ